MIQEILTGLNRGWQFVPLNGKIPIGKKWQLGAQSEEDRTQKSLGIQQHVANGGNAGLITGKPSGIVVIDLDDGALLTEDDFPPTWTAITGSGGKHLYYLRPSIDFIGNATKGLFPLAADGKPHIDIRGDGGQVVFVGSTHPTTGKKYQWAEGFAPADLPIAEFPASLIEKIKAPKAEPAPKRTQYMPAVKTGKHPWVDAALRNMAQKLATATANRNDELNATALILGHYCPEYLSEQEIESALMESMRANGYIATDGEYSARATIASGLNAGMRDPKTPPEKVLNSQAVAVRHEAPQLLSTILESSEPRTLAKHFLSACESRSLAYWMDSFYEYSQGAYQKVKDASVDVKIRNGLEGVLVPKWNAKEEEFEDVKLVLKNSVVSEVFGAIKAIPGVYLNENCEAPMWRDGRKESPRDIFTARNGLFNLKTGKFTPHDSAFFSLGASDFDFDPDAKCQQWEAWLREVFEADPAQILLLQEWFGYCLTYDCSQRKVMLLLGVTTSGKGTILDVLTGLLGSKNMYAAEPSDTTEKWFGSSVHGKRLVNFYDLRMGGRLDAHAFGSVILKLAEGAPTKVEDKGKAIFTARTFAKTTIASNNLPRFVDSSSAVAGRFLTLRFTKSFLGNEDKGLNDRLLAELPGIFGWALAGLERLKTNGWRWTEHEAGNDTRQQMAEECSPVKRFVNDCCVLEAESSEEKMFLFRAWKIYCQERNIQNVGTDSTFSAHLKDAFPQITSWRGKRHICDQRVNESRHMGIRLLSEHEKE